MVGLVAVSVRPRFAVPGERVRSERLRVPGQMFAPLKAAWFESARSTPPDRIGHSGRHAHPPDRGSPRTDRLAGSLNRR